MNKKAITSLEITDTHIKLIQAVGPAGNRTVQVCDIQRLNSASEEECAKALSALVATHHLKTQPLIAVIPRRLAILRHLSLPSHDENEIHKMVGLQIMNKVPYSREDIVYDYSVVGRDETGYSKVLVVLIHRNIIQRYLKMFEAAGISPYKITVNSAGLASWLSLHHKRQGKQPQAVTALINIDEVDSEICFCLDSKFIFSRNIQLGARDLNPEQIDNFMQQIDLTLKAYVKDKLGPDVNQFVISSALAEAGLLKEKLYAEYKKEVEVYSPAQDLPSHLRSPEKMSLWESSGYSIAVGLGVVLGNVDKFLNFIPSDVQSSKATFGLRQKWIKFAVLSGAAVILLIAIAGVDVYKQSGAVRQLQNKLKTMKLEVTQAESIIEIVTFAEKNIKNKVMMADVIYEVYRLTPEDIAFRSLHLGEQGVITVQGFSKTRTSVNNFQNQLVNSAIFDDVTLQYASRSRMMGKELTDFKITFKLSDEKGL